jgi:L-asparaginase/Glu-tRNA(Gln) amidotransferase subunit D
MDVEAAFLPPPDAAAPPVIKRGAAGNHYSSALRPGSMLSGLLAAVPELAALARPTLHVAFNTDSSAIGPAEWAALARLLHESRSAYDGFLVIHGTDTLAYTASALSVMLTQFGKPIVLTGSQLPLASPRSDARQNLIDAVTCIASGSVGCAGRGGGSGSSGSALPAPLLQEVAVCFGGRLLRGNRCTKAHSAHYGAFESPSYPPLAVLGVDVEWNANALLRPEGSYTPRFKLEPRVLRIPVVPGLDPRLGYGSGKEVAARGVKGVVLEAFGVGNIPDRPEQGWRRFLEELTSSGVLVCLSSQCRMGPLRPDAYAAGVAALELEGLGLGPHTPEAAVAKTMLCCAYPDLALGVPLAGEI